MPWKVQPVSDLRLALCHAVRTAGRSVAQAAREFGVSRKTAHKWLKTFDAAQAAAASADASPAAVDMPVHPIAQALANRSRRPSHSPARTCDAIEAQVLAVRDSFNWGPRKIHAYLLQQAARDQVAPPALPSPRTLAAILRRHDRIKPPAPPAGPLQRFERSLPNQLWQTDHKGPFEVARRKIAPLTVVDDCSRFCLCFKPLRDKTMNAAFDALWELFAVAGLPDAILCDNAFNTTGILAPGLSWFDSRLLRLGIEPAHGRPYHPQTQGKVERLHGSIVRELITFNARRDTDEHFAADAELWRNNYNAIRPHEALGDQPPASRWIPSKRTRPATLPEPQYRSDQTVRKIGACGEIHFNRYKILVGRGLAGDSVAVEDHGHELKVFYCEKKIRSLSPVQLVQSKML